LCDGCREFGRKSFVRVGPLELIVWTLEFA
jgi:hypothetical protein